MLSRVRSREGEAKEGIGGVICSTDGSADLRNKANWGMQGMALLHFFFNCLDALELAEGALVGALGAIDAALEAEEDGGAAGVGSALGSVLVVLERRGQLAFPDLSVNFGETAELPVVTDENVDEVALFGGGGVEALHLRRG
jgi:hypothetical protein